MARKPSISDQQILAAARRVFLQNGSSATTAEVAREAGVAEGSIFKRFPTKAALFAASMQGQLEDLPWLKLLREARGDVDGKQILLDAGVEAIGFFRKLMPLMMMTWSNPKFQDRLPHPLDVPDPPPLHALREITAFFKRQIAAGRIRRCSPEVVGRMYLGALTNYVLLGLLLERNAAAAAAAPSTLSTHNAKSFVQQLVHHLYAGIGPHDDKDSDR